MAVEIGQLRFTSREQCLGNNLDLSVDYYSGKSGADSDSSFNFKDVAIKNKNGNFSTTSNYYMKLDIPRDINYDIIINVKLIQTQNDGSLVYQFIKQITVPKGGTANNAYDVALYTNQAKTLPVDAARAIPLTNLPPSTGGSGAINGKLYSFGKAANKQYFVGTPAGTYEKTTNVNSITMIASWEDTNTKLTLPFEFTFTPVAAGFDTILLEMVRTTEDYGIQNSDGSYGRKLDVESLKNSVKNNTSHIFTVKNLLSNIKTPLQQIGIWSHPGLTMLINGEEIKIGPSGFYDLDMLPIETLGIIAKDEHDLWTLDYTYKSN